MIRRFLRYVASLARRWRPRTAAAVSSFAIRGQPTFVTLDYRACVDAGCRHFPAIACVQPSPAAIQAGPLKVACPGGHPIEETRFVGKNQVLTVSIDCIISLIFNNTATFNLKPLYFACGTSTAATTDDTVGLTAEAGRVTCAVYRGGQVMPSGYYKQIFVNAFLGPSDCNFNLQEFALMAGAATGTANSGTALARVLQAHGNKTSSQTVTVVWTITGSGT